MRRLLIFCVLLIIAVYANAVSYRNDVEDELSEDLDSPESFEDGTLDADMNNLYKRKSHEKHSKEKKKPHDHSKEKKSREHDYSKEKKSKKSKEHDHSKEKKSKEHDHSKEKKSKEHDHSKEKKSKEKKSSKESTSRPPFLDDTILPHEKFCKYYYAFNDFEARLVSCSKGQRFDAEKLKCLKTKEVNCGKRKKNVGSSEEKKVGINFKCSRWSGLYPHEYYCHLYYKCQNRKGLLFMCPPGMVFDDYNKRCADRGNVDCNKRIDPNDDKQRPTVKPEVFTCPSKDGKYPHERDCSAFYRCNNRKQKILYCPKRKLYNERKRACESENKVTCGNRIHPDLDPEEPEDKVVDPNPNFNCRENFGRYNHDQYCNWYYQCHDRRPSVRECRRGWRYHGHRRRCREDHEVTCDGKPDHDDATTEEITMTPISTEPETPSEPETTPTEPETTPTEPETTPTVSETTPTEPETTPTEPEATPSEPETTTPTPTKPEPTTTTKPKVTAPDTDCDEDDVDCIIEDLGITPDWFVCPEDMGSYPHPSSRKLFIFCLNWKPSVKKCGQELLYSEELRTCVHP